MSQTSPETEILPCPFCGSKPVTERTGFSLRAMYIYCINDNGCPRPKAIGETEEKAIENWNLRSDHAQTAQEPHETTYLRGWNEGVERSAEVAESYPSSGEQTEHPVEYWIRRLSDTSTTREGK